MRRFATGLAWGLLAAWPVSTWAVTGDGPPPLTPPVLTPPVVEPPAELPPPANAKPIPDNRPILVIPGVTTPRPGSRPRVDAAPVNPRPATTPTPTPTTVMPPLVGPAEMPRTSPYPTRRVEDRRPPLRPSIPLTLDPDPTPPDVREHRVEKPGAASTRPRPLEDEPLDDAPASRPAAPRRPQGLFGRFLPPAPANRGEAARGDRVRVEPRSDPATDAVLKRRIERQITESLGGRVRSYEVRVVGRDVVIRARTARFWQRRAVRTTLESLPALSGYKATILVDD
jgi:hypothetical protein